MGGRAERLSNSGLERRWGGQVNTVVVWWGRRTRANTLCHISSSEQGLWAGSSAILHLGDRCYRNQPVMLNGNANQDLGGQHVHRGGSYCSSLHEDLQAFKRAQHIQVGDSCRLWRNGATWVHVVVVQQQPACKPSHSMDVCAPHRWAVNCCYCSA